MDTFLRRSSFIRDYRTSERCCHDDDYHVFDETTKNLYRITQSDRDLVVDFLRFFSYFFDSLIRIYYRCVRFDEKITFLLIQEHFY